MEEGKAGCSLGGGRRERLVVVWEGGEAGHNLRGREAGYNLRGG